MKIKLKDLKPNPFRNFDLNPIDPERVKEHDRSIKEHGLWYPILVRKKGEDIQIVHGHHKVEASRNLYGDDHEIEVVLVKYDDNQMLIALATENDPVWNHSIREIDEMVSGAKRQLDELKKADAKKFREYATSLFSGIPGNKQRISIGAPLISACLKWPLPRVEESLTRLYAIEKKEVDRHALYRFPTASSAMTWLRIVRQRNVYVEDQDRLVHEIMKDGRLGRRAMDRTVLMFQRWRDRHTPPLTEKDRSDVEYCERILRKIIESIRDTVHWMEEFGKGTEPYGMFVENPTIDDIRPKSLEDYENAMRDFDKLRALFQKWLENLQENKEAEENDDNSSEKASIP